MGNVKVASRSSSVTSALGLSMRVIFARIPLNGPPVISTTSSSYRSSMMGFLTMYLSISVKLTRPGILERTCLTPAMASSIRCGPSASMNT